MVLISKTSDTKSSKINHKLIFLSSTIVRVKKRNEKYAVTFGSISTDVVLQ